MTAPLLTARDVGEILHLHVNTVKRLVLRGELACYRFGTRGDLRFSMDDVDAYLLRSRNEATDGNRVGVSGAGQVGGAGVDRPAEPAAVRAKDTGNKARRPRRAHRAKKLIIDAALVAADTWGLPHKVGF